MNREKAKPHNKAKNIESIYSLSPLQKGILFHSIYAPKSGAYCEQISLNLEGNVDIQLLEFACQKVIDRHPALRTLFIWENREKPLQVVLKQVDLPWSNLNWRELSLAEQKEQLRALLKTQREQGFQLNQAPLIECTLIKLGERVYKFIWTHHHILMDGWCLPIIFREILSFYEARLRGETCYLPTPPPYQRYIAWLNSQDKDAAISFWQQALRGFSTPTSLLGDRVRSQNESSNYQECELHLSSQVSRKLQTLVRKHHVTLSCVVQAVWGLLLSRYGGEKDVVFGVTVSGRTNELPDVENMVGLFINTLPLRLQIFPQQQLVPWLKEIQQLILELQQYSYAPLAEIQAKSELGGGTPLFESIVVFENYPVDSSLSYEESSLKVNETEVFEQNNYPLTVVASARDKLLIKISYDTLRFKEETIERILGHLQTLFLAVVENPQRTIAELPLLSGAEQHQLLVEWNDTQREYPSDNCLHGLFEAQVERTPDSIAIVFEQQQLTYQ
ncbi:MAG: condensation domain-containing protein, partial [Cyanobacteria bacterium J06635_15]